MTQAERKHILNHFEKTSNFIDVYIETFIKIIKE